MGKKIIIITAIVILMALAIYVVYIINKRAKQPAVGDSTITKESNPDVFPLMRGSTGSEVKVFQTYYNNKYPDKEQLVIDGIFGPKTEAAAKFVFGSIAITLDQYNTLT